MVHSEEFSDNFNLSSPRAWTVARELIARGVDARRIRTAGMADLMPLLPEFDDHQTMIPANMEKNRRVEIIMRVPLNAEPSH